MMNQYHDGLEQRSLEMSATLQHGGLVLARQVRCPTYFFSSISCCFLAHSLAFSSCSSCILFRALSIASSLKTQKIYFGIYKMKTRTKCAMYRTVHLYVRMFRNKNNSFRREFTLLPTELGIHIPLNLDPGFLVNPIPCPDTGF
jgi:hypothetical protein